MKQVFAFMQGNRMDRADEKERAWDGHEKTLTDRTSSVD